MTGKKAGPTNDAGFKAIIHRHPEAFVARFLPGASFVDLLSPELDREPLRADGLLKVRFQGKRTMAGFHFELQTRPDREMARRLCTYNLLAMERERMPIISTVIYLEKCRVPPSPWIVRTPDGHESIRFAFTIVKLWEEDVQTWLAERHPGLIVFLPFLKGARPAMIGQAVEIISQLKDDFQRENNLYYFMHFAKRHFGRDPVNEFLRRNPVIDDIIKEWPFYQEIMSQGLEQGLARGELQGLHEAIGAIIEQRFPEGAAELQSRIEAITDRELLCTLVVRCAIAPDSSAIRDMLPQVPPPADRS